MKRNPLFWLSLGFLALLAAGAILAPWIAPYAPNTSHDGFEKTSPSLQHLFGTDELGKDIFSRVLYGGRVSLLVGVAATFFSFLIGGFFGLLAGFFRGKVDLAIQFITDLTLSFPSLLLAMGITVVLNAGVPAIILSLSLVGWAPFARIVRGKVLELRERQFVEAARSLGRSSWDILGLHVIPNLGPVLVVTSTLKIGGFILSEAALSFLGLGPDPSVPTWGSMVYLGLDFIRYQPWIAFFPGLAIFLCVSGFNLLGEELQKK